MQKQNSHWYLSTSPVSVVLRSSWLLFPAIVTLLAFDVIESSIIAAHGDNSLTLLGFLLPIITLLSAIALAIAVRTNMVLVKEQQDQLSHIPSLLVLSLLVGSFLMLLLYMGQDYYLQFLDVSAWLSQFDEKLNGHYSSEIHQFLEYKIGAIISLIFVWQISSMLRAIGLCKYSAAYLFTWMAFKTTWLLYYIDHESITLISDLAKMHFYSDSMFALFGLCLLFALKPIDLSSLSIRVLLSQKRLSLLLTAQQLTPALSMLLLTAILSRFDEGYIAAFAILFRLEALLLLLPMVFTASLPTVFGICYWAGYKEHCKRILKFVIYLVLAVQLMLALIVFLFQDNLVQFLCPDCYQKQIISGYLTYLPLSYGFLGLALIAPSCLNAIGQVGHACQLLMLHRLFCVPLFAVIGLYMADDSGLFISLMLAHSLIALTMLATYRRKINSNKIDVTSHNQPVAQVTKQTLQAD